MSRLRLRSVDCLREMPILEIAGFCVHVEIAVRASPSKNAPAVRSVALSIEVVTTTCWMWRDALQRFRRGAHVGCRIVECFRDWLPCLRIGFKTSPGALSYGTLFVRAFAVAFSTRHVLHHSELPLSVSTVTTVVTCPPIAQPAHLCGPAVLRSV